MQLSHFHLFQQQEFPPQCAVPKQATIIKGFRNLHSQILTKIRKKADLLSRLNSECKFLHTVNADSLFFPHRTGFSSFPKRTFGINKTQSVSKNANRLKEPARPEFKLFEGEFIQTGGSRAQQRPYLSTSTSSFFHLKPKYPKTPTQLLENIESKVTVGVKAYKSRKIRR